MFSIHFRLEINNSIIIDIKGVDNRGSDSIDIFTIPSIITFRDEEWTVTIEVTHGSTEVGSPFVFGIDDTGMEFTRINSSIIVIITGFK